MAAAADSDDPLLVVTLAFWSTGSLLPETVTPSQTDSRPA
jgi:hypothetical protein